jgi:hypothetical protein
MNLTDLLESAGGSQSIAKLAAQFGLDTADAGKLIGALSPALVKGMQKQTVSPDTRAGLERAIQSERHQRYLDEPELLADEEARKDGNGILGHLFGSKDVSRDVAARAAEDTGIDAALIRKALPIVAGLAMGAMGRKAGARSGNGGGTLGALAGLLGGSDGKFGLDDVRNVAGKFF